MFKRIFLSFVALVTTIVGAGIVLTVVAALTEPAFPGGSKFVETSMWDKGVVFASGTWTMLNDRPADPIQSSEIRCYRESGLCFEAVAKLHNKKYLASELYARSITSWSQNSISYTENAQCVVLVYTIDRITNQVTGKRTSIIPTPDSCGDFRRTDLDLVLTDGFEIWKRERDRETPWGWLGFIGALLLIACIYALIRIWRSFAHKGRTLAVRAT